MVTFLNCIRKPQKSHEMLPPWLKPTCQSDEKSLMACGNHCGKGWRTSLLHVKKHHILCLGDEQALVTFHFTCLFILIGLDVRKNYMMSCKMPTLPSLFTSHTVSGLGRQHQVLWVFLRCHWGASTCASCSPYSWPLAAPSFSPSRSSLSHLMANHAWCALVSSNFWIMRWQWHFRTHCLACEEMRAVYKMQNSQLKGNHWSANCNWGQI